jgi:NADH-quinone oxidoreductase subunit D/NADH-quinone oxidoreductase subunit C/D
MNMAATPLQTQTVDLAARFPGAVSVDARNGYTGWLVEKDKLLEIARSIKDELGYDLLTSVTGVDYLPEGKMEVVYRL